MPVRQALDLLDVEDRVGLQKWDHAGVLAVGSRFGIHIDGIVTLSPDNRVGVDDGRPFLTFADMATQLLGLLISHPDRRRVPAP